MSLSSYLRARKNGFRYAANGVRVVLATQAHARIHLLAAVGVVLLAWGLDVSAVEWCILLLAIGMVWTGEAVNTAIELTIDLASPDYHPLAGKAKDVAAGAVLLASCLAAVIGAIVFVPKLVAL